MNSKDFIVLWLICLLALVGIALMAFPLVIHGGIAIGRLI